MLFLDGKLLPCLALLFGKALTEPVSVRKIFPKGKNKNANHDRAGDLGEPAAVDRLKSRVKPIPGQGCCITGGTCQQGRGRNAVACKPQCGDAQQAGCHSIFIVPGNQRTGEQSIQAKLLCACAFHHSKQTDGSARNRKGDANARTQAADPSLQQQHEQKRCMQAKHFNGSPRLQGKCKQHAQQGDACIAHRAEAKQRKQNLPLTFCAKTKEKGEHNRSKRKH